MKRFGLLAVSLLLFVAMSPDDGTAQTRSWQHQLYFNGGPQFVTGDAADAYQTGLALEGGYYYRATNTFFVGVAGGYHQFKGEGNVSDIDIIPLHLAAKYNFSLTGVQPYIGMEGGPYIVSNGESSTDFGLAPRLGVRIPLSSGFDLDLNVKYNMIFQDNDDFTYVGLNGGPAYIPNRNVR
ncbi:MAG: outer membrane beta-barrel protein [Longimonas sp.]|uniref:outer membrane beta-barrel protein n=1 Tax=Longimonas sp. TaxID=2039626 RepID=UPI0039765BE1